MRCKTWLDDGGGIDNVMPWAGTYVEVRCVLERRWFEKFEGLDLRHGRIFSTSSRTYRLWFQVYEVRSLGRTYSSSKSFHPRLPFHLSQTLRTSQLGRRARLTEPVVYVGEVFGYTQKAVPEVNQPVAFRQNVEKAGQATGDGTGHLLDASWG